MPLHATMALVVFVLSQPCNARYLSAAVTRYFDTTHSRAASELEIRKLLPQNL